MADSRGSCSAVLALLPRSQGFLLWRTVAALLPGSSVKARPYRAYSRNKNGRSTIVALRPPST